MRFLVAAALLVCACDPPGPDPLPFEPAGPDAAPDPSTFGPFPVGVRTLTFVDESRNAPPPLPDGPRTLVTEIWYPAVESARLAEGEAGERYVLFDALPVSQQQGLKPEDLGTLETIAVRDAAPRTDRGPYPLVLFSHGKGGLRQQSTFYTVTLASHGYVVVSPDHQGDTIVETLETGDVDIDTTARSFIDRPIDLVFLMNEMDALEDPLREIVDISKIATTGHSFGAFTAMATAGQNVGVTATVAQTPVGIGLVETSTDYPLEEFGIPVMIQSSGEDRILPAEQHAQSLWDHMVSPRAWLHLPRGGHFTYSDLCILDVEAIDAALTIDASNVLDDGCGPANTPPAVAFKLINNAAIGFFNIHLRGSTGSAKYLVADDAGESTLLVE